MTRAGVVADDGLFAGEVAGDAAHAEGLDALDVGDDGGGAFGRVAGEGLRREGSGVDQGAVEDGRAGVLVDALDVLGGGEAEALVGLGHEIADEDAQAAGVGERGGDSLDEQIGDERGVERAGADGDEVGALDGVQGLGQGARSRAGRG